MTIDERLEKLTKRHEWLAQTVELLAIENRALSKQVGELGTFVNEIANGTARRLSIAQFHQQRIPQLEGSV